MLVALAGGFVAVMVGGARSQPDGGPARAVVSLTRLPGAALSVDYLEPRVRAYADLRGRPHPEFSAASSLDFTHER